MSKVTIVLLIIAIVMVAVLVVLYFLGKKAEKKKAQQDEQIAAAQSVSMLVIDKKKLKITEAGFPASVVNQMPKLMRRSKLPIVKAKVGPKVMSFICEASIFDSIPVKKEVKATVSSTAPLPRQPQRKKVSGTSFAASIRKPARPWRRKKQNSRKIRKRNNKILPVLLYLQGWQLFF